MNRIILTTFLAFFASFSSLWAQDLSIETVAIGAQSPRTSYEFSDGLPLILQPEAGFFEISASAGTNTTLSNVGASAYTDVSSFLSRPATGGTGTTTLEGKSAFTQRLHYGVHTGADPRTANVIYELTPTGGGTTIQGLIPVVQLGEKDLIEEVKVTGVGAVLSVGERKISSTGSSVINSRQNVITVPHGAGSFTVKLLPGDEVAAPETGVVDGIALFEKTGSAITTETEVKPTSLENSHTVTFSYTANTTADNRTAGIVYQFDLENYPGRFLRQTISVVQEVEPAVPAVGLTVTAIPALDTPLSPVSQDVEITYTHSGSATAAGVTFSIVDADPASLTDDFITESATVSAVIVDNTTTTRTFTIEANSTAAERQGTIQFTATNGTTPETVNVVITQSGSGEVHTISVATDVDVAALPSAGGDITFTVTLGGGAEGFTATRTAVTPVASGPTAPTPLTTFSPVSQKRGESGTFTITYGAATLAERTATITIATTGTGSPVLSTMVLRQAAGAPEVSFTVPEPYTVVTNADGDFEVSPPLTLAAGSITVTATPGGTTTRANATTLTGSFLTLGAASVTFPDAFTSDVTQVVDFSQNDGAAERQDTVKFTPTDGTNTPTINLILQQAGTGSTPDFRITTVDRAGDAIDLVDGAGGAIDLTEPLSAAGGDIVATIVLLGNSTSFSATITTNENSLLEPNALDTKTTTTQTISYNANATGAARVAVVTFTISNADGGTVTREFNLSQEAGNGILVTTNAADLAEILASPAGTITATITLSGSATAWSVEKTGDDSHAFIADFGSSTTGDATSNTLMINYKANAATSTRTATLTFTATGGSGPDGTQVLALTQLAATPTITIVEGATLTHPLIPSSGTFDVTYTYGAGGISATSTIVSSGATDFLEAEGSPVVSATNSKEATQTFSFKENAASSVRTQTIQFTATGVSNNVTEDLVITQSGATEPTAISVTTDTDISGVLSASSGTITATITLSGSATGFQVSKSGDADDSFISAFTSNVGDRTDNTLTIEYSRNTRFNERFADLIFRTTGGVGAATTQTLSLRQALSLALDAVSHAAATHTETFASALAPLGATKFSASIVTNPGDFLTLVTSTADLTSGSPTFDYSVSANTGAEREGEIEITYTDADDDFLALHNIVITQSAQILVATTNADGDAVDVSNLSAESGVITATVTLAGTGTNWTAAITGTNKDDFRLSTTAGDATTNTFTITYDDQCGHNAKGGNDYGECE